MCRAISTLVVGALMIVASPSAGATLMRDRHDHRGQVAAQQASPHAALTSAPDEELDVSAETVLPTSQDESAPAISFVANGSRLNAKVVSSEPAEDRYLANFRIPPGARQILANGSAGKNGSVVGILTQSNVPEPTTWIFMLIGLGIAGAAVRNRQTMIVQG